jgi:outer membrane protein W
MSATIRTAITRAAGAALAAAAALAGAARAQEPTGQFSVTTRLGGVHFDRAASLKTAPFIGLDAEYGLSRNFAVGTEIDVTRPSTRAEDFLTTLTFGTPVTGDTTLFFQTGQAVSIVHGGLLLRARYPGARLTPFAVGGAGYYAMFFDPQISRGTRRETSPSLTIGGGVGIKLTDRAGLQLDARDLIFTDYKASRLDPSGGRNPNIYFPEDFPTPPARKSTVHNILFSIGFRYVPSGARGTEGEAEGSK